MLIAPCNGKVQQSRKSMKEVAEAIIISDELKHSG
jgi:hypothetical protein